MAMAHTGDRKLENVGNIGRAGPQREQPIVEHKLESKVGPEDSGGSAHSSWKKAGISKPKGKVFCWGSHSPATREHPVREQSSP